jgi:outer membrane protein OmpA-like peptidoglycan-associated protein
MIHRSKVPHVLLAVSAVLAAVAVVLLVMRTRDFERHRQALAQPPPPEPAAAAKPPPPAPPPKPQPEPVPEVPGLRDQGTPDSTAATLRDLGIKPDLGEAKPEVLVDNIAKALEAGDVDALTRLLGKNACDEETLGRLKALATAGSFKLSQPGGVREVGELELGTRVRWGLKLDGPEAGHDQIFLDLVKRDGKWTVEKLTLPPAAGEPVPRVLVGDPLGVADMFLQAALRQDFESASRYVDTKTVSDVKIASLCIMFEEGHYRIRQSQPLRAMFKRGDTMGYLAQLESTDGGAAAAQFGITLRQAPQPADWNIVEINLDDLLADYAQRVADGDIYYSPLVKNPHGGDTLALYFEFDEDAINPRTQRQLEIVARVLLSDPGRKITLSGHTDAIGTDPYNDRLSAARAATVRDFLIAAGVAPTQISTQAKGATEPRRPNVTESGDDNPRGRRANRRTEIYLDF